MADLQNKISDLDIVNDDIFTLLGLQDISDDQKQQMMSQILQTVQNRVMARLLDVCTKEERDQIEAALEKKDFDGVNVILAAKGLGKFTDLVMQEVMIYKLELVSTFNPNNPAA